MIILVWRKVNMFRFYDGDMPVAASYLGVFLMFFYTFNEWQKCRKGDQLQLPHPFVWPGIRLESNPLERDLIQEMSEVTMHKNTEKQNQEFLDKTIRYSQGFLINVLLLMLVGRYSISVFCWEESRYK